MRMAKNDPKHALAVLKPCGNAFTVQKINLWVLHGPKNHLLSLEMPENSQKGHLRPENLKFKLMHFQTVGWDAIAITAGML